MSNDGQIVKFEMLPREGDALSQDQLDRFRRFICTPGSLDRLLLCLDRFPAVEASVTRVEGQTSTCIRRCDASDQMFQTLVCPGQMNFSQRTLDEYSGKNQVKLNEIVTSLGDPYVNTYPVPPGKKIRLTHRPRPGYTPTEIRIDLNLAGGGNNYSDFLIQFFLVPGGTNTGLGIEAGNAYDGNMFLNKDGTQLVVPFPEYRALPLDIGSLETLAVVISNNGAANNLDSAHVNVFYDNSRFYELCKARCGGSCASPSAAPM